MATGEENRHNVLWNIFYSSPETPTHKYYGPYPTNFNPRKDTLGKNNAGSAPGLYACHNDGGNQEWTLTKTEKQFRHNDLCLGTRRAPKEGAMVVLGACTDKSTRWDYVGINLKIENHHNLCLDSRDSGGLMLKTCDHSIHQTFKFELKDIKA